MEAMTTTRIILADDHEIVRAGLRNALLQLTNLSVIGEVGSGPELFEMLAEHPIDLLLIDVAMPDFEPIAAVRQIKAQYPNLKVLVVSAHADESYLVGLLDVGVDGYHLKDQPLADLQLAVQRVIAGDRWISGPLVERLLHHRSATVLPPTVPPLTRRQRELLHLLAQGHDNRKIAQTTGLSVKTVENHLTRLYRALGVYSRSEALSYLMHHPEVLAATGQQAIEAAENEPGKSLSVLLVDDNPRYRQQLARMIGKTYPATLLYEADDIAEAVRLADSVKPQLALIDVVLTDEDGIYCTRRVKAVSPATRVVLISAYPDREFHRLGLSAGAVAFLDKKDLDATAVRQVIDDALV
jgi:DNA-binding NarL/FixJ family response regulator